MIRSSVILGVAFLVAVTESAHYLGCFRERSLQDRLFKGDLRNFTTNNTHEVCIDHCISNGFLYAGVQFGRQCFCSNERPSYEWLANSEDECNMPCSGDPSQVCGAHRRMGVYSLADPEPGSLPTSYVGCHAGGALREVMVQSGDLSLETCKDLCEENRYRYFGAAEGSKCFCGNDISTDSINERECRVPCGGDKTQLCGGSSEQLSVYRSSISEPETAHYLGCFRERSLQDRLFKGDLRNFTTNNTHEVCIDHCRSKGFLFAGVQFGRQCFCSNERPSYEWLANSEDECNMPCSGDPSQVCGAHRRMGVYSLADPEPGSLSSSYIGCHAGGALREMMGQSIDLNLVTCRDLCEANSYRYFGTAKGSKCYCGNDIVSDSISERECRVPCGGDNTQLCGGSSEQLSVYRTSTPELETALYLGCFRERSIKDRLFKGDHQNFTTNNTHEVCIDHCRSKGFLHAGVQFGRQCFCSNERPSYDWLANSEDECNMPCSGDPSQVCGAHMRMGVYSLADPEPRSLSTSYIGCHAGRALREMMGQSTDLSLEGCKDLCEANRYRFFGATQGTNCFCGNDIVKDSISERECRVPCRGDKTQLCGGSSEQLSVYRTSIPDEMILDVTTIGASSEETTVPFSTEEETETRTVKTETEPVTTYIITTTQPIKIPATTTSIMPVSTTTTRSTETKSFITTGRPVRTTTTQPTELPAVTTTASYVTTTRPTEVPVLITTGRPVSTTAWETKLPHATTTIRPLSSSTTRPIEMPDLITTGRPVSTTTIGPSELPVSTTTAKPLSSSTTPPTEMPALITTSRPISTTNTQSTKILAATTTAGPVSITTKRTTEIPALNTTGKPVSTTTTQSTKIPAATTTARPVSITTKRTTEIPALNTTGRPVSTRTMQPTKISAAATTSRPVVRSTTRPTVRPAPTTITSPRTTMRITERPASTTYTWQYNPTSSSSTQSGKYKKGKKPSSSEEKKNKKNKKKNKKSSSSSSSSEEKKKNKKYKKSKEDKKDKKSKKKSKRSIAMYTSHALGCYKDEQSKLLPDFMVKLYLENTPQACVDLCAARNYSYAGVQRHECFCSKTKPDKMDEAKTENCFSPCPGTSLEICGGWGATSVFEIKS